MIIGPKKFRSISLDWFKTTAYQVLRYSFDFLRSYGTFNFNDKYGFYTVILHQIAIGTNRFEIIL